jgi:hypothetical protein
VPHVAFSEWHSLIPLCLRAEQPEENRWPSPPSLVSLNPPTSPCAAPPPSTPIPLPRLRRSPTSQLSRPSHSNPNARPGLRPAPRPRHQAPAMAASACPSRRRHCRQRARHRRGRLLARSSSQETVCCPSPTIAASASRKHSPLCSGVGPRRPTPRPPPGRHWNPQSRLGCRHRRPPATQTGPAMPPWPWPSLEGGT